MPGKFSIRSITVFLFSLFVSCREREDTVNFYDSDLFKAVQLSEIFPDSKTFVDCIARRPLADITDDYKRLHTREDFDLKSFVEANFELPVRPSTDFSSDPSNSLEEHITQLWPVLTRLPDRENPKSSLLALPHPYIVPGGRFSEIYYWDSYFTMLGLEVDNDYEDIRYMVDNFAHLINTYGFIPNGNRNYYLSRSQPPFFVMMVKLLHDHDGESLIRYLPELEREYMFWMNGEDDLREPGDAKRRVVMLADGTIVNRYYDDEDTPRPESYREDIHLAEDVDDKRRVYRNIRAAAESGWDFSSRWFEEGRGLASIRTIDIIPVDLNCLLWSLERALALGYSEKNDNEKSQFFTKRANERRRAILTFFWDPEQKFFFDYNFVEKKRTHVKSLAGLFPLYVTIPSNDVALAMMPLIEEFLKPGGMVSSLVAGDEQWDSPNGWAPLQWVTYQALVNYNKRELARTVAKRWLRLNEKTYRETGKMMEKYNVIDTTLMAGGGEYPNQDGFGWTNGVALAFLKKIEHEGIE